MCGLAPYTRGQIQNNKSNLISALKYNKKYQKQGVI